VCCAVIGQFLATRRSCSEWARLDSETVYRSTALTDSAAEQFHVVGYGRPIGLLFTVEIKEKRRQISCDVHQHERVSSQEITTGMSASGGTSEKDAMKALDVDPPSVS